MFATATGKLIDPTNIKAEDICIEDIAHHLSKIQRYNGALPIEITYSVAEHCINLHNYYFYKLIKTLKPIDRFSYKFLLFALLHDATEAYFGDLISGFKKCLSDYKNKEEKLENLICTVFKFHSVEYKLFKENLKNADKCIVLDEIETICPKRFNLYKKVSGLKPLNCDIIYNWKPAKVKREFLRIYKELTTRS